jgi:hypothetical protein
MVLAVFGWTDPKMAAHDIAQENRENLGTAGMDTIVAFDETGSRDNFHAAAGDERKAIPRQFLHKCSYFNADCGFMVRSEGARICCDFNGLPMSFNE